MNAFDDDGSQTLAVGFSYPELEQLNHQYNFDIDAVCQCQRKIWEWVGQDFSNKEGVYIRSVIACWVFMPVLRDHSMTMVAGMAGKKKQSLGRWVKDFKKTFPELNRIQHIKHD